MALNWILARLRMNRLTEELIGATCRCGKAKRGGESFCVFCMDALPNDFRFSLRKGFGAGYEEAYDAALATLKEKGLVT